MYVFMPKCGSLICYVLLTAKHNDSSRTDNSLDFYSTKTKQYLQTKTYCQLLGPEETSSVAYNLGETQTSN